MQQSVNWFGISNRFEIRFAFSHHVIKDENHIFSDIQRIRINIMDNNFVHEFILRHIDVETSKKVAGETKTKNAVMHSASIDLVVRIGSFSTGNSGYIF
jgi:hypothetical protein